MHKIRGNYSCTCRSNENILSSSRGAQEKGKRGSKLDETQFCVSEFHPLLKTNILSCRFFLYLTRFWTKLRVLVLCFPDFTENSIGGVQYFSNQKPVVIRLGISVLPLRVYFSFALRKNMSVSVGPSNKYKAYFKTKEFSYTTWSKTSWMWSVGWKITTISEQFPKQHNEHR
jgi:hypothetical protein